MTQQHSTTESSLDWEAQVATSLNCLVEEVDFFQAIRRIEALAPHLPRVGQASQAEQEAIRIRQTTSMDFAPSTIDRIDTGADGRAHLSQRFFGLLGPNGPMPLETTEEVRHRSGHLNDPSLEAFLNLFHHRMAMLFYRAWSSSRGAIQRDRPEEDRFAAYVGAVSGVMPQPPKSSVPVQAPLDANTVSAEASQPSSAISGNDTRLYFTGRFASSHRNAEGLQSIVSATLGVGAVVKTFMLRQLRLQAEDITTLTRTPSAQGRGGRLGQSIVLGRTIPDRRSMIGLELGPLSLTLFQRLLPGGASHGVLKELVRGYLEPAITCRVRLILDRRTVPRMSLGRQGTLGRNAWMHCKPPGVDIKDCQFDL